MRVLHVLTLVSPDGAFGGPVAVATHQTSALRARGHDVRVLAGARGYPGAPPTELGGTPLRAHRLHGVLPGAGFSGLTSPALVADARRALRWADVVHVHLARDLVTLPVARLALAVGTPLVLQPHGMVVPSAHPLAGPLDALATRTVLRRAAAVLHLTPAEEAGLRALVPAGPGWQRLTNGIPDVDPVPPLPARPGVLFLGRLVARKRPALFASTAAALLGEGIDADFALVGPDEGEGPAVRRVVAAAADPRLRWEGALAPSAVADRLAAASLVVLPSVAEPFPVAVLEAMAAGRGVVVVDDCGLAPAIAAAGAGAVVGPDPADLLDAVRDLLTRPGALAAAGSAAWRTSHSQFSMAAVTTRLETIYATAVS
ncbi:glycosyltransferase [Kineococcus sp. R86509]|uniref:glycosyltransferase n=1 Tax=Kineococcus sp. R86509 TaxID=3093851 RepID=UPI0036D23941